MNRLVEWISGLFGEVNPKPASLIFRVEEDGSDFVVSVNAELGDRSIEIDPRKLARYGAELEISGRRMQVSAEDYQTVLSILDRDPRITDAGQLRFEQFPPELEYLRSKANVEESERVAGMKVANSSPTPRAEVDFDPKRGASVSFEMFDEKGEEPFEIDHGVEEVAGGEWIRADDKFYPKPSLTDRQREWLNEGSRTIPLDDVPEFFVQDLAALEETFQVDKSARAERVRIIEEDQYSNFGAQIRQSSPGWLNFDISYEYEGVVLSHREAAENGEEDVHRVDDHTWVEEPDEEITEEVENALDELGAEPVEDGYKIELSQYSRLERFIEQLGGEREVDTAYREFLDNLRSFEHNPQFEAPEDLERRLRRHGIELRDYQRSGIHWLNWLRQNRLHGILADDMGLGKTVQALVALAIAYRKEELQRPSLVVTPKSIMGHWEDEARKVFPLDKFSIQKHHGQSRDPRDLRTPGQKIFISTYGTVRSDIAELGSCPLFAVILDEATKIKNPDAKRSKAVKQLQARFRIVLSGTPIENHLGELWSVFDFLMPEHLGDYATFQREFQNPIEADEDDGATERLQSRIKQFLLRRTKDEVEQSLPEKIQMPEYVEMTEEQKQIYAQLQAEAQQAAENLRSSESTEMSPVFKYLTHLKQVCVHPGLIEGVSSEPVAGRSNKFDVALEKVRDVVRRGEQLVIFSQFLDPLDLLEKALTEHEYIRIDGSTDNRHELITECFDPGHARIALCSTLASSHGINLQAANHVVHLDFWWNPAIMRQATDRVHRIGQDKTVYEHQYWVKNSLEEKIREMLRNKRQLAEKVITSDVSSVYRQLSSEELAELLSPVS